MQLLAVTKLTRLHGYEATGTIRHIDNTIHALLCSVGEDIATSILLGILQCLLAENIGGVSLPKEATPLRLGAYLQ
jgi:hypothetical protein